jgi:predicted MFS family arabinose efflux permease
MEVDLTADQYAGEAAGMTTIAAAPPRLLGPAAVRLLAVDVAAMTSFYLLLSVVPLYAAERGIGAAGAGLSTGVLMVTAVAAELATPALAARVGFGRLLAAGLVLLGAPALALSAVGGLTGLLAVAAVRGTGFAIVVVAIGVLAARAIPEQRRGEGLGVFGLAATVPAVVALPLGVWLAGLVGFPVVCALGAGLAVAAVPLALRSPTRAGRTTDAADDPHPAGRLALPADVLRPAVVFFATAVAGGVVVAFLPGAVAGGVAAPALLVQAAAATLTRWLAGRYADRRGGARLLAPAVVLAGAGMATAAAIGSGVAVLAGMALFGTGFGLAQAASLTTMLRRVTPDRYGAVSAVWNAAYDLGWGVGAIGVGLVVASLGAPAGFVTAALLALAALPLATRRRQT